ncbi:MAG: translation initiation factor IF-2 [Gemmatimonadota bacterium]
MPTEYRVYEAAEELGIETTQLIQMLREMDVPVRSHMSTVEPGQVARLHARLERERRGEGTSAPGSATTTRRRRRRRVQPRPIQDAAEAGDEGAELPPLEPEPVRVPADLEDAALPGEVEVEEPEPLEPEEPEAERPEEEAATAREQRAGKAEEEVPVARAPSGDDEESRAEPAAAEVSPSEDVEGEKPAPAEAGKPEPARQGMPAGPTVSAAPGGTVRIQAEGYTVDGRRKSRRERKKRRRVDQGAVQENVKRTLAAMGGGGTTRRKRREADPSQQEEERERREREEEKEQRTVRVNEFLTVAELADLIETTPQQIITSAFKNLGLMVTINQRLDFDQIELICEEFGFQAKREQAYEASLAEPETEEDEVQLEPRAPVVTVMGHVDHGKTSLLDHLRRTNVIAGEAGGITQHIGAYHVQLGEGRSVTFLDTPGHEAFTAMRARGAEVTDIVILVVAADDSVMPQTMEAISHAKNAGVPLVVAINKIDLPTANPDKVKQELLSHEVVLEEYGGEVLAAEVSAKTGQGIDDLLEKVLLQAELLELRANPDRAARGTVIEAELDRGMGPVATVLVESGTLRGGQDFLCGLFPGRVRALLDERGNNVEAAGPSVPVRVLGLEGVPQAGDSLVVLDSERVREITTRRQQLEREKEIRRRAKGAGLSEIFEQVQAGEVERLNLVIKGDTDGSVQALSDALEKLSTSEVAVEVIHRGVGGITESDVLLATTSRATILGFHVRADAKANRAAGSEGVEIRLYDVIYEAVEEVRQALEGMLKPSERETVIGTAEVRQLFRVPKVGTVAGCYISSGTMRRNLPVRVYRDQVKVYEGRMESLKRFKEDVREVREGFECGISIEGYNDVKVDDLIECYEVEEVARTLAESAAG